MQPPREVVSQRHVLSLTIVPLTSQNHRPLPLQEPPVPAAAEATPRRGFFGSLFAGRGPAEPVAGSTDVAPAAAAAGELIELGCVYVESRALATMHVRHHRPHCCVNCCLTSGTGSTLM